VAVAVRFFVQSIFDPAGSGFALGLVSWMLVFGLLFFYQLHGWRLCFSGSFFSLHWSVCNHIFLVFVSPLSLYIPVWLIGCYKATLQQCSPLHIFSPYSSTFSTILTQMIFGLCEGFTDTKTVFHAPT